MIIVYACTGVFLAVALADMLNLSSRQQSIAFLGLSYTGLTRHCGVYQLATAPLLHAGVGHLLFNMLSLWMLGPPVEKILGCRRYIVFSVVSALASMLGFLLLNWRTDSIGLGYSGVIFGILVAQAIYFPNMVIAIFAFFPVKMKHAVILFMATELYLSISPESGGIANISHLCGGLAAFCYLRTARLWQHPQRLWGRLRSRSQSPQTQQRLGTKTMPPPPQKPARARPNPKTIIWRR